MLFLAFLSASYNVEKVLAQEVFSTYGIDEIVEKFVDTEDENNIDFVEEIKQNLSDLADNPLNLNTATKEDLEQLPFLSSRQIENILFYVYNYGSMKSIYELRLVEDMDITTIQLLTMFAIVDKADNIDENKDIRKIFRYGRSEFYTRFSTGIQHKKGYEDVSDSLRNRYPGSYYLGSPFYSSLKYRYYYKDRFSIGFVAEKDPGEEFFRNTNKKGYDFYSMHFYLSGVKWLKAFAAGSYKASFGKGLVISNDFYMGKSIYAANIIGRNTGIRKHSSTDEVNFFHGIAATASVKRFDFSVLYSFRKLDASVVENEFISSLKNSGYHRLKRDIESRNKVNNNLIGSNIKYNGKIFNFEITSVYNVLNKMLKQGDRVYDLFYPSGREFFNISAAYDFRWKNIFFSGETALDGNGHIATLNTVMFYPVSGLRFVLLHRYYDIKYTSLTSSSFASNGRVQNESGIFIGAESDLSSMFKLSFTFDSYRHQWLKYNVYKPSSGEEISSRLTLSPGYNLSLYLDYRYKKGEINYADTDYGKYVYDKRNNKVKLYCGYVWGQVFSIKTYIDYNFFNLGGVHKSHGLAVTQNVSIKPDVLPIQISCVYSLFDTEDYDSRIYVTTKNLPNTFYFPSLYGKGLYFAGVIRYDLKKLLTVALRYSIIYFDNVEKIGTGSEEIAGNKRDDIGIAVIVRF